MDPLKMYFLLKMGIFHCYVSLPEGMYRYVCMTYVNVNPVHIQVSIFDLDILFVANSFMILSHYNQPIAQLRYKYLI